MSCDWSISGNKADKYGIVLHDTQSHVTHLRANGLPVRLGWLDIGAFRLLLGGAHHDPSLSFGRRGARNLLREELPNQLVLPRATRTQAFGDLTWNRKWRKRDFSVRVTTTTQASYSLD